jgi:adenosine/AMP kinase
VVSVKAGEKADVALRTAHLLRINSYLDIAINAMWTSNPRVDIMIGMAEASLRGESPGGKDDEMLEKVRDLVREGRAYLADGEPSVAMGRMRVAHDFIALSIIRLSDE